MLGDDRCVAREAAAAGAVERGAARDLGPARLVEVDQIVKAQRCPALVRVERRRAIERWGGRPVERAHLLAVIAAEEVPADRLAELIGRVLALLDREVGDAAARIEDEGGDEGFGGAGVEASRTGAAALCHRGVGDELERGHDLAEDLVAPLAGGDHEAVLADEADPGTRGPGPLHHGLGIAERAR